MSNISVYENSRTTEGKVTTSFRDLDRVIAWILWNEADNGWVRSMDGYSFIQSDGTYYWVGRLISNQPMTHTELDIFAAEFAKTIVVWIETWRTDRRALNE